MFGVSKFANKLLGRGRKPEAKGREAEAVADERTMAIGQMWAQVSMHINSLDPEDWNLWHWLQDLYYDPTPGPSPGEGGEQGQLFAITISAGRLYRWPVAVDGDTVTVGDPVAVVVEFSESAERRAQNVERRTDNDAVLRSTFTVRRSKDGRWVGCSILCTATVNKMGILDSRQLFDSFAERFKGDGTEYVNVLHLGGARSQIGFLRHVWREEKLLVGIYEFYKDDPLAEASARTLATDEEGFWGGSIEFKHFGEPQLVEVADGVKLPMTHDGQLFGYSIARNQDCAAWYTGNVVMERAMTKREREIALELLGDEELVDELQERLGEANRALDGAVTRTANVERRTQNVEQEGVNLEQEGESEEGGTDGLDEDRSTLPALRSTLPEAEPVIYELEPEALEQIAGAVVGHRAISGRFEQLAFDFEQLVEAAVQRIDALTADLAERAAALDGRLGKLEQEEQVRYRQYDLEKPKQPVVKFGVRPRERAKAADEPDVQQESTFARKTREKRVK
jgi:hypothetical protein